MTNHNDEATEQLEEVSGRWLRDQLRDVADIGQPSGDSSGRISGADASASQLLDGLALSISTAVVEPIRGLELRREAQQKKLEGAVQELSQKLGDAFVEIGKLRDEAGAAAARVEGVRSEVKLEMDGVRTQLKNELDGAAAEARGQLDGLRADVRRDVDQLGANAADIRSGFSSLAEEIGRLQEKVREQHERIEALRLRETQRAKAMNELAKASSSLKEAITAAAAISSANEYEPGAPSRD